MNPFLTYQNLLKRYLHNNAILYLEKAWNEPHRKCHNINHLTDMLNYIEKYKHILPSLFYDCLILAAFFHDAYYNPRDIHKSHEDESKRLFLNCFKNRPSYFNITSTVLQLIEVTKYRKRPQELILRIFWEADNNGFMKGYNHLMENEKLIRQENNHVINSVYRSKRIKFLKSNLGLFGPKVDADLNKLIKYVEDIYKNY